jgi:branched-chain amino acid transport system permease protein
MNAQLERIDRNVLVVCAVAAATVPFVLTGYEIKFATTITIQAGFAVAVGFVVGPGGLTSLGHASFYGLAAYLLALTAPQSSPANLVSTALLSIAGAAMLAAVVGAISIRSRGLYFILMTLAFGQLGYHFFNDAGIAGNSDGAYVNFRPELILPWGAMSFDSAANFYWLVYATVCGIVGICWWLRHAAFGSILVGARNNEERTRAFGYSAYRIRLVAFVVSGAMAGAMGYLTAAQHGFVAPQLLAWHASAIVLVMVLIGGKETTSGPIIGAVLLLLAEEVLQRITEHWLVGVGLIIVAVVLVAPNGIVPYAARWLRIGREQHV